MLNTTHWNYPEKIKELLIRLVKVPSISGTSCEKWMAEELVNILNEMPYFQKEPNNIFSLPIEYDPLNRSNVIALFKGKQTSSRTIVLLSHFDVVGVSDYGNLKEFAFLPEDSTQILKNEWKKVFLNSEIHDDLMSDNWLFGRGTMDMKAGLAIQLAILSELSQDEEFSGNTLLVGTPDEETNSAGMFAAIKSLNELKEKYGLEYEACICSEPNFGAFPQDRSKSIYTGAIGKLLPIIFCAGKETHAGEPMEGVNAGWMASNIVNCLELSSEFVDQFEGEANPPPTCIKISDLKDQYNVQTPNLAYVLYNILTLKQSPLEVLHKIKGICEQSSEEILNKILEKYQEFFPDLVPSNLQQLKPKVYTYHELYIKGKEKYGDAFIQEINRVLEVNGNEDSRDTSVKLGSKIAEFFRDEAPFYLTFFAPPYYPHVHLDDRYEKDRRLKDIVQEVADFGKAEFNEEIKVRNFLTGLSDVSYCRIFNSDDVITTLKENMPLFDHTYKLPINEILSLNLPTINIGPFGKDAHKHTERLELNYSTTIAPYLLKKAIQLIFRDIKT